MINFFVLFIGIIIGYAIAAICIISSMESKKGRKDRFLIISRKGVMR